MIAVNSLCTCSFYRLTTQIHAASFATSPTAAAPSINHIDSSFVKLRIRKLAITMASVNGPVIASRASGTDAASNSPARRGLRHV